MRSAGPPCTTSTPTAARSGRPPRCAAALTDITEPLDLVAILVGDPLPILRDAVAAKAKFAVVFAAGFAEVGAAGEKIQAEMEQIIAAGSSTYWSQHQPQRLRGLPRRPARQGHRPRSPRAAPGPAGVPGPGDRHPALALGPGGNEADLESADFIRYFSDTGPPGPSPATSRGSRTGAPCSWRPTSGPAQGPDRGGEGGADRRGHVHGQGAHRPPHRSEAVVSAVFRQYGVNRVDGLDQLLDVSAALARTSSGLGRLRRGSSGAGGRVCVYSISGARGPTWPTWWPPPASNSPADQASQTQLHQWIPPYLRVSNPVDNGGAPVRDWRAPRSSRPSSPTPTST